MTFLTFLKLKLVCADILTCFFSYVVSYLSWKQCCIESHQIEICSNKQGISSLIGQLEIQLVLL